MDFLSSHRKCCSGMVVRGRYTSFKSLLHYAKDVLLVHPAGFCVINLSWPVSEENERPLGQMARQLTTSLVAQTRHPQVPARANIGAGNED
jgi:hypothetical protein